jgi:hypothetical protein
MLAKIVLHRICANLHMVLSISSCNRFMTTVSAVGNDEAGRFCLSDRQLWRDCVFAGTGYPDAVILPGCPPPTVSLLHGPAEGKQFCLLSLAN